MTGPGLKYQNCQKCFDIYMKSKNGSIILKSDANSHDHEEQKTAEDERQGD